MIVLGLKKKLLVLNKEKECEGLIDWIKSIINQLYWVSTSTPDGSPDEGHADHFSRYQHGDLDPVAGRKRWLRPGMFFFILIYR